LLDHAAEYDDGVAACNVTHMKRVYLDRMTACGQAGRASRGIQFFKLGKSAGTR